MSERVRLLITVGTDHHRFDRLMDWVDLWLERNPDVARQALVQHGASRPSRLARNAPLLPYPDLQAAMESADAVLTHGGPASIFEARRYGHQPLCVPRNPELSEHVDDHQMRFVSYLARAGLVKLCHDQQGLYDDLDRAFAGVAVRNAQVEETAPSGLAPLATLVQSLADAPKARSAARRGVNILKTPAVSSDEPVHDLPVVAYQVQSFRTDRPLARLLNRIRHLDPDARLHVEHSVSGVLGITPEVLEVADSVTVAPGGRGDYTGIERLQRGLRAALTDPRVDFVTVISGEDYPCADLVQMRHQMRSAGGGWVHRFPMLDPRSAEWPLREGVTRYTYRWRRWAPFEDQIGRVLRPLQALNRVQPWVRVNTAYRGLRVGWRDRGLLPGDLVPYGGPYWVTLSRAAAQHVLDVLASRPEVVAWARYSLCPDEALVPTLVESAPHLAVEDRITRYVDFSPAQLGHPRYLEVTDLPRILQSGAHFCRKVASEDLMDSLDRAVDQAGGR